MAEPNEMSTRPDDSPNNTKKRVGISVDEGSAVMIKDQNKRLKVTGSIKVRNKVIDMELAIENLQKTCINPRTGMFYVNPVLVVTKEKCTTMDRQEYEKIKEKQSASSSPSSVMADLDLERNGNNNNEDMLLSFPNNEMRETINNVINSGCADQKLVDEYNAACRRCKKEEEAARRFAEKMERDARRLAKKAESDKAIVEKAEERARDGDVQSMLNLASWHEKGSHRLQMCKYQAYLYYKKAADFGNSIAQEKAGHMLIKGPQEVKRDVGGGIELLSKATTGENTSGKAAFLLGFYYFYGKNGFTRSFDEAKKWLILLREQEFHRPASEEDLKEAFRILNEIKEREDKGYVNPRSSPM
eukprot:CAMPEP_0181034996 /NCGR_PEP_ID=MMETSP1070-20121207/8095_1 /TAXON_ID=265543 /ORGANISM="Minutocellus polymorphus, Strain NH13" /LENGTH=357 /DNA_ID=CAMNT_0023112541 /DNA_START=264 /DNA_END=1337 /DNA_ORIENTATION=-